MNLEWHDFLALSPLLILFFGSMLIILIESFSKKNTFYITLAILILSLISVYYAPASTHPLLTPWIRFDPLAQFLTFFFISITLFVLLISPRFSGEYFFLLLSATLGLLLIGSSADFLTLFLGIETLSIPLYILCGFIKKREISHESAAKYFLTGALATAFLVYGIALVYGATGTTHLKLISSKFYALNTLQDQTLFYAGIGCITLALGFKAALVPFHQWAPDVYAGAPTSVTAYMAVATKAGAFAAWIILFFFALPKFDIRWNEMIEWISIITLTYANFVALKQTQMRRFFAYSGIAQAGFLLIAFVAMTPASLSALLFYLVVYALATLGCFTVLAILDETAAGVRLQDLHGLYQRAPWLCLFFSLCLLTLAGIPPTAGFLAKFLILKEAFEAGYILLVIVALVTSILSITYYLRPIALMLQETGATKIENKGKPKQIAKYALALLIICLSLFPFPLWDYLQGIT